MQQPHKIWVYNIPHIDYLIVKRTPFSYQIPMMDSTGTTVYKIVNGVYIDEPVWEHVVKDVHGHIWATFQDNIYNVSELFV